VAKLITGVIIEKSESLTLEEFCHATHARKETIIKMIEYQLIEPQGESPEKWRFDSHSLKRGRIAASFYHDLEINMQGVALALELLDKIESLQHQIEILNKNIKP
jgi:chaperone modulatory protein CbpM